MILLPDLFLLVDLDERQKVVRPAVGVGSCQPLEMAKQTRFSQHPTPSRIPCLQIAEFFHFARILLHSTRAHFVG